MSYPEVCQMQSNVRSYGTLFDYFERSKAEHLNGLRAISLNWNLISSKDLESFIKDLKALKTERFPDYVYYEFKLLFQKYLVPC